MGVRSVPARKLGAIVVQSILRNPEGKRNPGLKPEDSAKLPTPKNTSHYPLILQIAFFGSKGELPKCVEDKIVWDVRLARSPIVASVVTILSAYAGELPSQ